MSGEHSIAKSLVGAVLKESCDCRYACALDLVKEGGDGVEWQLKYTVVDRDFDPGFAEGPPQDASILNAFLQMSFDEGGTGF